MADIIKLEELRQYLFLPVKSDGDKDMDNMKFLITAVSAAIDERVGYSVSGIKGTTEKYDGTGKRYLYLKNVPVTAITSVKENGNLLAATEYYVDLVTGVLTIRDGLSFNSGFQNWEVAYNYGANPSEDIKLACKIWCAYLWKQAQDKRFGVSAISHGGEQVTFFDRSAIPREVDLILMTYQRKVL